MEDQQLKKIFSSSRISISLRHCYFFVQAASVLTVVVAFFTLLGWAKKITTFTSILPGLASMKTLTALCFLFLAAALWVLRVKAGEPDQPRKYQVLVARTLAGLVATAGLFVAGEYFLKIDWGMDDYFFHRALLATGAVHPGRMSLSTATAFFLLGASLLLIGTTRRLHYVSQVLALLTFLNGLVALVGHIYGVSALYEMAPYATTALHTATLFLILGLASLACRPQFGVMKVIVSDGLGGLMARRVLPIVSTLPILLGWLRWQGELAGHYKTAFGLVLFTLSTVIMLNVLLWFSAFWLNRVDEQRQQAVERDVRLAAIVASSQEAIFSKNLDGTITSWNQGAERLYHYSANEIIGQPVGTLIPVELQNDAQRILHEIGQGRPVKELDTIRRRKDGRLVHVSLVVSPIRDGERQIIGASSIAHDISERKRAEAALQESEERLQLFIQHAPAALAMFDRDMRYMQVSRHWRTEYGLGDRLLIGVSHYEIFPETSQRWKDAHRRGLAGEIVHMESDQVDRADGAVQWLRWEIRPWLEKNGEIGGIMIFTEDITESTVSRQQLASQAEELTQQSAELFRSREALAEQTRTLQSVLDNINDGLVVADTRGNFLVWNPAADRILGKTATDLPPEEWSKHYRIYLPDGVTPFPTSNLPLVCAIQGHPAYGEMFIRYDDAGHGAWLEASASPLHNTQNVVTGGVVAFRDVTQRVIADREIRRLNTDLEKRVVERTAQLEAVNKELESFTYSVSHDLRAPLRQISGFAKILIEDFHSSLPPEAQRYLSQISNGVENMTRLINEMLNLSRLERQSLQRQQVLLADLVSEVVTMLRPEIQQRQVEWRIASLPRVDCDPVLTKQILQNLISNALKYSRKREQAVIEIGHCGHEGCTAIFVGDNGVGFDMKYADKLFGAFQRLHRDEDFEGIGIGLATVARIVRKHGGKVWAEAQPGHGATFYFTLASADTPKEDVNRAISLTRGV